MAAEREILIEGRGISAHNLAAELADNDWNVLLSGKEFRNPRSWFVLLERLPESTKELIRNGTIISHPLSACRFVVVDSERNEVTDDFTSQTSGQLNKFACLMIDDKATKEIFRDEALQNRNVSVIPSSVRKVRQSGKGYEVLFKNGERHVVNKVVDASGSASKLLRNLEKEPLKDDALVFWIFGWRVRGQFDADTMIFPLKDKSTGRMSWVAPWSSEIADVLAADYCRVSEFSAFVKNGYFQESYERFRDLCASLNICRIDDELEKIYGRIRIVPIDSAYGGDGVYAVGDAAGQADPNMAEGIPPAILNSSFLAAQLNENPNYRGIDYYQDWRFGQQKIEPYELSTSFVLARYPIPEAGQNARMYKAIANMDIRRMKRILSERQLKLSDLPELLRLGFTEREVLPKVASTLIRARLAFSLPNYRRILYGENGL